MGKKRKATIAVNPVTWDGKTNKVLKYQAVAQLNDARLFSNPMHTQAEAMISLLKTCKAYTELAKSVVKQTQEDTANNTLATGTQNTADEKIYAHE